MKRWAKVAGVLLSASALLVSAQSAPEGQDQAQETQKRGYWIDPSTGLMWAGKDNGKDVSWNKAMKYCRNLRLAGYSDWRLASLEELRGIYDRDANAPGLAGPHTDEPFTFHVKGNLFLTGMHWSSTQILDERGRPSGYAWRFDFNAARDFDGDELWFHTGKRALCVRGVQSPARLQQLAQLAQETQARGYWIDPSTGLMWAGKDNGRDVDWHKAAEYCRDLRLAGYPDWRLATIDELQAIYDKDANVPGRVGPGEGRPFTWRIQGSLLLTGIPWSSTRLGDDRGQPSGYAWHFDFNDGRAFNGPELGFYDGKRALCVRDTAK